MKTIYKITLDVTKEQAIHLPVGARILSVGEENNTPRLWYMFDTSVADFEERTIRMFWSSDPIPDDEELTFLGTVQAVTGGSAWHLFEKT